jgi:hypothetical protein
MHTRMDTHVHMHTCTHIRVHTHTHTCSHIHSYTSHRCTYAHPCIYMCNTHSCTHIALTPSLPSHDPTPGSPPAQNQVLQTHLVLSTQSQQAMLPKAARAHGQSWLDTIGPAARRKRIQLSATSHAWACLLGEGERGEAPISPKPILRPAGWVFVTSACGQTCRWTSLEGGKHRQNAYGACTTHGTPRKQVSPTPCLDPAQEPLYNPAAWILFLACSGEGRVRLLSLHLLPLGPETEA